MAQLLYQKLLVLGRTVGDILNRTRKQVNCVHKAK